MFQPDRYPHEDAPDGDETCTDRNARANCDSGSYCHADAYGDARAHCNAPARSYAAGRDRDSTGGHCNQARGNRNARRTSGHPGKPCGIELLRMSQRWHRWRT